MTQTPGTGLAPDGSPGVIDHGGGVWSIEVPIPDNPLGHTLVHLLDTDRGPVLIDTGWDDPTAWNTLTAGLAALGVRVEDVHGVLVTHHHPDHHGLSGQVRDASGAWIAMHAADAQVVRRTRSTEPGAWLDYLVAKLTAAGAPEDHLAPLHAARASGRTLTLPGLHAALPDRDIAPGELLPLAGRRLRAVWTPGHTPGHVCLHLEEEHPGSLPGNGRLFSGDHLLPDISPHIGLYEDPEDPGNSASPTAPADPPVRSSRGTAGTAPPSSQLRSSRGDPPPSFQLRSSRGDPPPSSQLRSSRGDPLGDYLVSLERVARLGVAEVLPAHQHAFTGARARVAALLAHHETRLAGLRALLAVPLTPWQLATRMEWNRPWEQIPYASRNIAVSEAEAHLRRMVRLGHAEAVPGSDPVTYTAV
ncbi:MBL fold metallo-hydrolase [Streptomyces sp. CA-294286]|uniref:MBL fold metallo-hydrolase n=1 Tax=Streptomyces sp. CA-294286 TaxID=3240070 RepID=UPI003D8A8831